MSDLLSTIIAAAPHTATVITIYKAAKPVIGTILKPALEEVGELGRDYIKSFRATNGAKVLADAGSQLAAAQVESQQVPLKTLVPLLEAASLEEDDFLRGTWATLLASAANPARAGAFDAGFVDIMKQLSTLHVIILNSILDVAKKDGRQEGHNIIIPVPVLRAAVGDAAVSTTEFDVAIDNLLRLRLCASMGLTPITEVEGLITNPERDRNEMMVTALMFSAPGKANIEVTDLGSAFIKACTPLTAEPVA